MLLCVLCLVCGVYNVYERLCSLTKRVSFSMVIVVARTTIENTNVQIGSANCQLGIKYISRAAMNTPTLCKTSPKTWIKAARTLIFSVCSCSAAWPPPAPWEWEWESCSCHPMLYMCRLKRTAMWMKKREQYEKLKGLLCVVKLYAIQFVKFGGGKNAVEQKKNKKM